MPLLQALAFGLDPQCCYCFWEEVMLDMLKREELPRQLLVLNL